MESTSYLMMLYVTLEQESALKNLFLDNGWEFSKPDLSVTTDKLGPGVPCKQDFDKKVPLIKPSFPTIKMNAFLPKRIEVQRKRKKDAKSFLKPVTHGRQTRSMKGKTVASFDEYDENVDSGEIKTFSENVKEYPVMTEINDDEKDFTKWEEDIDGDGDDDYEAEDMENDSENEYTENIENEKQTTKTHLPTDNSSLISDTVASDTTSKEQETKTASSAPHVCSICSKTFSCKKNLNNHVIRHGEKKFTCPICSKGFYRMSEMKQHIRYTHEGKVRNVQVCDVCGKTFDSNYKLEMHRSYKHSKEPMDELKCKVCGQVLSCKKKRVQHEQRHVEGFKFTKCDTCGRLCKNIEDHKKFCSREPLVKKHKCGVCEGMFTSGKYLEKHLKSMHGFTYACIHCGLTFSDKKAIANHNCTSFNVVITETLDVTEEIS